MAPNAKAKAVKKPNPFFCFMKQRRRELEEEGERFPNGWPDVLERVNKEWEKMSLGEKEKYKTEAKESWKVLKADKENQVGGLKCPQPADTDKDNSLSTDADLLQKMEYPEGNEGMDMDPEKQIKETIAKLWSYPEGLTSTAIVLQVNHYVDRGNVSIPAEIGMASFNVQDGLADSYSTLVDPDFIPAGYGMEAVKNANYFGLPHPPFSQDHRDYKTIVDKIEKFIDRNMVKDVNKAFLFCRRKQIPTFTRCFHWLYGKAGVKFEHELLPVEGLVTTISLGGLEHIARMNRLSLKAAACSVHAAIKLATRNENSAAWLTVEDLVPYLGFPSSAMKYYTHLSSKCYRLASRAIKNPSAILGVFTNTDQAEDYFYTLHYEYLDELACPYHQMNEYGESSDRLIFCALSVSQRIVYQILDTILLNYRVKALPGRHHPLGATLVQRPSAQRQAEPRPM